MDSQGRDLPFGIGASSRAEQRRKLLNERAVGRATSANKVKYMNTAMQINKAIRERSRSAELVFINMPKPSALDVSGPEYMDYLSILTEGLKRVILVRSTGAEVVTVYS